MIRRKLLAIVAVMAAMVVLGNAQEKQKDGKLDGSWNIAKYVLDGTEIPPAKIKGLNVVVKGDRLSLMAGKDKKVGDFTYKMIPTKSPKHIDLTALMGKHKGKTSPGIYKMDDNTLTICIPNTPGKVRPKDFSSEFGSGILVMTLKRTK